jgi:addiction module HigA family antidote
VFKETVMARYQSKRSPTHPGEILKEDFLSALGITQTELAKALKTSFRTISEILNEKRSGRPASIGSNGAS